MKKSENRRIQNVLKYFMLCIIVLGVSFITGGKTVYAKLQISGDKSLIQASKCSQTFDGTKDFVIWMNPAKIKKGVQICIYFDGAAQGVYDTTDGNSYKDPYFIKSIDKSGKVVLRKERIIEFNDQAGDWSSNPYKGFMSFSVSNGKSCDIVLKYDLTKIKNQKYIVTYETKGGNAVKSQSVRLFGKFPNIRPTRRGYTFTGWNEKNRDYKTLGDWSRIHYNMTAVANWRINKYSISYNYNGGTKIGEKDNPSSYTIASSIVLATPGRTGYKFEGWYTDKNYKNRITRISGRTGNLKLYAKWSAQKYQVVFNANGGSRVNGSLKVSYNSVFGQLPSSKRKDYTFEGWFTKTKGGTKVTPKTKVTITRNITLYAQWKPVNYKISYYSNVKGMTNNNRNSYNITTNNFTLTNPTLEGYTFAGWYADKDYKKKANTNVKKEYRKNITFYAKFIENTYTIQYDPNGGTGDMKSIKCVYSQTYELQKNQFTNGNRKFTGWNTEKNGNGSAYADGAHISKLCANKNGKVILYAQWKREVSVHAYRDGVSTGSIRRVSQQSELYANGWTYRNRDYTSIAGGECGAACSSMAVSYLGVDISPGEVCYKSDNGSAINTVWISWSGITPKIGSSFTDYFNNYENDESYKFSPVIIHLSVYPGTNTHYVVVIGKNSDGTYKICDPVEAHSSWNATISGNYITGIEDEDGKPRVNCEIDQVIQYVK